jgi:UDP-N-acetylmuramyl pentapeptide phosphotransferase/UDP-N-acetylglucosamine-1-phosphate transferase
MGPLLDKPLRASTVAGPLGRGGATVQTILLAATAALLAWLLTGAYMRAMVSSRRLEPPSDRGMHKVPVPTGAGIALVATALALWSVAHGPALTGEHALLLGACATLTAISWVDDRRGLSPAVRLPAHAVAVALLLAWLGPEQRVVPAVPLALERVVLGVGWLWFINLFNFMDGLDGLAGSEAIAVAAGYLAVVAAAGTTSTLGDLALLIAAACTGYLFWNWHPAKVFMGDAGAIPLGCMLGWLMIDLACHGLWAAAAILPLYFAADATLTLGKRLLRGKRPWQPHREHFYQRAVLGGTQPSAVVWLVSAANAVLIALALASLRYPLPALAGALAVVAGLLIDLERRAGGRLS